MSRPTTAEAKRASRRVRVRFHRANPPDFAVAADRFWANVDRRGPDECWPWLGRRRHLGHGSFSYLDVSWIASRVVWELENGTSLGDLWTLHTCDNGWCCNPAHLYAGTHRDNVNDRMARHRHHDVSGENHPMAKLTWAAIRDIRARRVAGELLREIAARYDTTVSHIGEIVRGELWREKP